MKAAFIQTAPVFGDIEANVEGAIKKSLSLGADIVVLPELFSTGYQFRSRAEALKLSEDAKDGLASVRLIETAKKARCHIVAGIAEKAGDRVYNSAVLIGPKGLIAVYRKAHLFWNEKKIFSPGNTPFEVYDIGAARVGMMICFDWIFPEAARTLALKGADIIAHPANLVLPYCPAAMLTRSIENRVFSITANRVGVEERIKGGRLKFIGSSQIVSPTGEVLASVGKSKAAAGVAEIDVKQARDKHITPLNDIFKDRRRGMYLV
ncbi:MAG: acyltransferase [Deltaproteobacteria bacterium]|nr:acyltransferase [Deltaproteobacteria bacterium]